jgi:hypothetical protein
VLKCAIKNIGRPSRSAEFCSHHLDPARLDTSQFPIFEFPKNSASKKLLLVFPLSMRFILDIVAARFYTFFNCNLQIADSMQPIEKGE